MSDSFTFLSGKKPAEPGIERKTNFATASEAIAHKRFPARPDPRVLQFWKAARAVYSEGEAHPVPRQFDVVIERDSEGYVASVPQITACHTQARSLHEVTEPIRDRHRAVSGSGGHAGTRIKLL